MKRVYIRMANDQLHVFDGDDVQLNAIGGSVYITVFANGKRVGGITATESKVDSVLVDRRSIHIALV